VATDLQSHEMPDQPPEVDGESPYVHYRALSVSAVSSLIVGVLSLAALLDQVLWIIPVLGILLGAFALVKIRRWEDEMTGAKVAKAGIALSAGCLLVSIVWSVVEIATEVPEGYERLSYRELQPDPNVPGEVIPPKVMQHDGKRRFVKGYTFPGVQRENLKQFVLVPDRGTCCFGGNPKVTDVILVTLKDPHRVNFSYFQRKFAGTFHVNSPAEFQSTGVLYELEADYVR